MKRKEAPDKAKKDGALQRPEYNPGDAYALLTEEKATEEKLIDLLLKRIAPFLPSRILVGEEREAAIQHVISAMADLRGRYLEDMTVAGYGHSGRKSAHPDVATLYRAVDEMTDDEASKREFFELVDGESIQLNADIVRALGFSPNCPVPRPTTESLPTSLIKSIPPLFRDVQSGERSMDEISFKDYRLYSDLSLWIEQTNKEVQECIKDAANYIDELLELVAPDGPAGQSYGTMSDLSAMSLAELFGIVLTKQRDGKSIPLRRRFEAFRLLEWALALFSIRNNLIYQAQEKVRRSICGIMRAVFWEMHERNAEVKLAADFIRRIEKEEIEDLPRKRLDEADNGNGTNGSEVKFEARRVGRKVEAIMDRFSTIIPEDSVNALTFDSRAKEDTSTALKVFLAQEAVLECRARLQGFQTGMSGEKSERLIAKMREKSKKHGYSDELFEIKPASVDMIDDKVGITLGVPLSVNLENASPRQRERILKYLEVLGEYISGVLGLENIRFENYLWNANDDNTKSSGNFRLGKLHGDYKVKIEDYDEQGNLVEKVVAVPVEFQLQPIETNARLFFEKGRSGKKKYKKNKARKILPVLRPSRVVNKEPFSTIVHVDQDMDTHEEVV